jgi:lycopene beta-cyclase
MAAGANARVLHDEIASVEDRGATTVKGERFVGKFVVDSRGPNLDPSEAQGWQKFLGLELELAEPCNLDHPILMDATVPQTDGFRFFYTLPLEQKRILVEDTYYADDPSLNVDALRAGVLRYAESRGWKPARILREETGALPIPWRKDWPDSRAARLVGGYAGGWFHPTTGYSLPCAIRFAEALAQAPADQIAEQMGRLRRRHARQARFLYWLNWMLFRGFAPGDRWRVLERFYRLPLSTIQRFYAMELTAADRLRIVCGRPPEGFSLRLLLGTRRAS